MQCFATSRGFLLSVVDLNNSITLPKIPAKNHYHNCLTTNVTISVLEMMHVSYKLSDIACFKRVSTIDPCKIDGMGGVV